MDRIVGDATRWGYIAAVAAAVAFAASGCLLPPLERPSNDNPSPDTNPPPNDTGNDNTGDEDTGGYGGNGDDTGVAPTDTGGGGGGDEDTGYGNEDTGGGGGGEQDTGNGSNGDDPVDGTQVATMLGNHCGGCHASADQPPAIPTDASESDVNDLVGATSGGGQTYITAGSKEDSFIWNRMNNDEMPPNQGWGEFAVVDRDSYNSDAEAGDVVTEKIGEWIDNQ